MDCQDDNLHTDRNGGPDDSPGGDRPGILKERPAGGDRRGFLKAGLAGIGALCMGGAMNSGRRAAAQAAKRGLVRRRVSPWFRRLERNRVECTLCPRKCVIAPGRRGGCRVRENLDGVGQTLVYGTPTLVQVDPVERKPFFHVLPGTRALSVSTSGCPLECAFCEVWDLALVSPEDVHAHDLPPERVVEHALEVDARSVSFAFGEPVAFYEYAYDTAVLARRAGLLNLVHTSAYINPEPLALLAGTIDAVNVDLKGFDPEFYRERCGAELGPVLENMRLLRNAGVHLEITNLLIPSLNDDMQTVRRMVRWIRDELGPETPLHFARFYPLYKLANLPPTPVSTLDRARAAALEEGLEFVYVARVTGHEGEKTYCPSCGTAVIDRLGFVVEDVRLSDGRCSSCGCYIAGLWE